MVEFCGKGTEFLWGGQCTHHRILTLQRAAVSISSNIAEGAARSSSTEFIHFLNYALGSAFEVETQLLVSKNIGYLTDDIYSQLSNKISSIERQLNGLISSLRKNQGQGQG